MTAKRLDPDLKVLLIDDLPPARKVVRKLLEKLGVFNVKEAAGVVEANQAFADQVVDLVIADLNLKDGSGLDLAKSLKEKEETKEIPIILITSDADRESVMEGAALGIGAFLIKPFGSSTLLEKIEEALG